MKYLRKFESFDNELVVELPDGNGLLVSEKDIGDRDPWYKVIKNIDKYNKETKENWRLPDITELETIHRQLPNRLKSYNAYGYWSSSEEFGYVWWFNVDSGDWFQSKKNLAGYNALMVKDLKPYEVSAYKYNI